MRGRAHYLLTALLLLAGCRGGDSGAMLPGSAARPNILLLVIDCLRADHLGVNGYQRAASPNLDAVARQGVNFTQAFAQSHWTRPSLPTILTGLYPSEHGLVSLERRRGAALSEDVETVTERLQQLGYATALMGEQYQLSPQFGLRQGFDYYRNHLRRARAINDAFLAWVDGLQGERFFAYLHYLEIHWPYCPPKNVRGVFGSRASEINFCRQPRQLRAAIRRNEIELSQADVEAMRAAYDEELLALDARLGTFFERLREAGLWDETLVVVTSDHGEEFYERGGIGHQATLFDELIHVPLVFKPPSGWAGPRGANIDALVELRDLAPTFLVAAGDDSLDPRSTLVPHLVGRSAQAERREFVIAESTLELAVRTSELKLVVPRDGSSARLYDLALDPGETTDVAADRRQEVARLLGYASRWRSELQPTTPALRELEDDTVEGLRALGYVD